MLNTPVMSSALLPKKPAFKKLLVEVLTQLLVGSYWATPETVLPCVPAAVEGFVLIVPDN